MVEITPLPPRRRWMLRGRPDTRAAASHALGVDLPEHAYGSAIRGRDDIFWLEPDAWLIQADGAEAASRLREALQGLHHALAEVSERFAGVAVTGSDAIAVLQAGCPLDLHSRAFPTGRVTRTLLGKAEIILFRRDDAPAFELLTGLSFAPYLRRFLDEAAREFHPDVA